VKETKKQRGKAKAADTEIEIAKERK